jgi:hypothetical protein
MTYFLKKMPALTGWHFLYIDIIYFAGAGAAFCIGCSRRSGTCVFNDFRISIT